MTKLNKKVEGDDHKQNLRKLLSGVAKNFRVAYIKLADRLHNLRTIQVVPSSKQERVSLETLEIYVPLAIATGISFLGKQLKELSIDTITDHKPYASVTSALAEYRRIAEDYLYRVWDVLHEQLRQNALLKGILFDSLIEFPDSTFFYDSDFPFVIDQFQNQMKAFPFTLQVWADTDESHLSDLMICLSIVEAVHNLWHPVSGSFQDYISTPMATGYQSLHTTVIGPHAKKIQLRVSSSKMRESNEYGPICRVNIRNSLDTPLEYPVIFSQLLKIDNSINDTTHFLDIVKSDLLVRQIRVYSQNGQCFWLPTKSTPIDFAYCVDKMIGHSYKGAIIDNQAASSDELLVDGSVVEIITDLIKPQKSWKNLIRTKYASYLIDEWFITHTGS